jgi:putative membrane protein
MTSTHVENPSLIYSLLHWVVSAFALMITAYIVRGFEVKSFFTALIASVIIGFANAVIWPILIFLTLPINILTLGLFTFVVNGMVLKLCAAVMPGFQIKTWFAAIVGAIILSVVGTGMHYILI